MTRPRSHDAAPPVMSRRAWMAATGAQLLLQALPGRARDLSRVTLCQLVYRGGDWRPRETALRRLCWEVRKRTAVPVDLEPISSRITGGGIAWCPLVYMSGDRGFDPFSSDEVRALRRFVHAGGTLVIDPAHTGSPSRFSEFRTQVAGLLRQAFYDAPLRRVPSSHVLFRAFYALDRAEGLVDGDGSVDAVSVGGRLAVILFHQDLGGAWDKDNLGNWRNDIATGGDRRRENAIAMGVNTVLYALCGDYKNETPHREFSRGRAP